MSKYIKSDLVLAKLKGKAKGGVIPISSVIALNTIDDVVKVIVTLDKILADRGVYDVIAPVILASVKQLEFLINTPEYLRFKKIYVDRIPALILRWEKIRNKITFIMNKSKNPTPKKRALRINRLRQRQSNIVATIKMLFTRLNRLQEYISGNQVSNLDSELNNAINQTERSDDNAESNDKDDDGGVIGAITGLAMAADELSKPISKAVLNSNKGIKPGSKRDTDTRLISEYGIIAAIPEMAKADKERRQAKTGKGMTIKDLQKMVQAETTSQVKPIVDNSFKVLNRKRPYPISSPRQKISSNVGKGLQVDRMGHGLQVDRMGSGLQVDPVGLGLQVGSGLQVDPVRHYGFGFDAIDDPVYISSFSDITERSRRRALNFSKNRISGSGVTIVRPGFDLYKSVDR